MVHDALDLPKGGFFEPPPPPGREALRLSGCPGVSYCGWLRNHQLIGGLNFLEELSMVTM